ncbi:hypothetical protein Hanom_Chr14g01318301 [Helianthus anomalus]
MCVVSNNKQPRYTEKSFNHIMLTSSCTEYRVIFTTQGNNDCYCQRRVNLIG